LHSLGAGDTISGMDPEYVLARDWLHSFEDTERQLPSSPAAFNLPRTQALLQALGEPQQHFPAVVIAGTKGKGSTAAMVEAIVRAAGLQTGLYTSPHLHSYRERIQLDRQLIAPAAVVRLVERLKPAVAQLDPALGALSIYEVTTALALLAFAEARVACAVLEIGLGGRWDAVNVVTPLVSAIASISLDHTRILGDTHAAIAFEKAGIIKPGVPVVTIPQHREAAAVLAEVAHQQGAPLFCAVKSGVLGYVPEGLTAGQLPPALVRGVEGVARTGWLTRPSARSKGGGTRSLIPAPGGAGESKVDWQPYPVAIEPATVGLAGAFQLENGRLAVGVAMRLRAAGLPLSDVAFAHGLAAVSWPGRLEVLRQGPWVVADGAHNGDSARKLAQALRDNFPAERLILILGVSADKDLGAIAAPLVTGASAVFVTRSRHPRSASLAALAEAVGPYAPGLLYQMGSVEEALLAALQLATPRDLICCTGSLFVAAEAREYFGRGNREE
jgi:dihydrofolate synthase/folylpolyglutamate synthase